MSDTERSVPPQTGSMSDTERSGPPQTGSMSDTERSVPPQTDSMSDTRGGAPPLWLVQHPAFLQMEALQPEDRAQLHAAFLVYLDLTEVRRWKQVSCVKSSELQVILLEAREKEGGAVLTVLPLPVQRKLSHRSIRHVLDRGFPVLLCAVAADSTLVYQRMTDGLVTPEPPVGPFQDVGRRQHRKRRQREQQEQ